MTFLRLLGRNLLYHWRGNVAVLLGVALGTAVLTGALLVGDSLRGSLQSLTLGRLGWVEEALTPGRFFRAALAAELPARQSSAAVLLSGSASNGQSGEAARWAGGVTVFGVDASFWQDAAPLVREFWESDAASVVLNRSLADLLGAEKGDRVTLHLQRMEDIPRESLLGKRRSRDVLQAIELTVRQVVPDTGLGSFGLRPTPEPSRNAFVPLRRLQAELGLAGEANTLLVAGADAELAGALGSHLTLQDWGLRLRSPEDRALAFMRYLAPNDDTGRLRPARWRGRVPDALARAAEAEGGVLTRKQVVAYYENHRPYVSLESRQLYLSPAVVEAANAVRGAAAVRRVLVGLADEVRDASAAQHYVVIGAVSTRGAAPLLAVDAETLAAGIILVETPEAPWGAKAGQAVTVSYYEPDDHNHLRRTAAQLTVGAVVPIDGALDDPDLTPAFPGITDKLDIGSWENPPFPYNPKVVTRSDEEYWKRYRATPRAYVSMARAQALWGSRFGPYTSVQFFGIPRDRLARELLGNLSPERGGYVFQPVRARAREASSGSADFGVLFLSFSAFLIASALLLVGLLLRLNLDRRAGEIGLLLAVGWDHPRVRRLLLGEGAVLAAAGGAIGLFGALAYARLMLDLLRASWPGGEALGFLRLHAGTLSFVYGYAGSLAVSLLTVVWATNVLGRLAPRSLLAGETTAADPAAARPARRWAGWVLAASLAGATACLLVGCFARGQEAKAGSFFGSGSLLLIACLAAVWLWLRRTGRSSSPQPSLTLLGVRNAGRHAVRSELTVGLLAAATFLVVAVESFHKEQDADFLAPTGGSGGFALVAETDVPIFEDLNRAAVRRELGLTDPLLEHVRFVACRVRRGDDASCLNLYRPLAPRVIGVPEAELAGRFHFGSGLYRTEQEPEDPWSLLRQPPDAGAVPTVLDSNTAQWVLKKSLGETLEVDDDRGRHVPLRVVGLLDESILQSELLVSEASFRRLYPTQEGFAFFLIECPGQTAAEVQRVQSLVEAALAAQGVRVQSAAGRLQAFQAVENTYLATFQALGGLGLILGAAGLAVVLLRGVWERRSELALLRALGFGPVRLAWLVLAENLALLALGLAAGTLAALLSVAPHLAGAGAHVLWLRIGMLLLLVLATGLVAGGLAVIATLRAPLVPALRRE